VSDQTAIALATLILAGFWMVVSADGMTAPPRRLEGVDIAKGEAVEHELDAMIRRRDTQRAARRRGSAVSGSSGKRASSVRRPKTKAAVRGSGSGSTRTRPSVPRGPGPR
jgi:hypothetical protein